jgi:hypothetical protein
LKKARLKTVGYCWTYGGLERIDNQLSAQLNGTGVLLAVTVKFSYPFLTDVKK